MKSSSGPVKRTPVGALRTCPPVASFAAKAGLVDENGKATAIKNIIKLTIWLRTTSPQKSIHVVAFAGKGLGFVLGGEVSKKTVPGSKGLLAPDVDSAFLILLSSSKWTPPCAQL